MDFNDFNYIKNILRNDIYRNRDKSYFPEIPPELSIQLTQNCNLRCKSCMQWSDNGFIKNDSSLNSGDLSLDIFKKILAETEKTKSSLHLWGGEPLLHKKFEEISNLLNDGQRRITINTNGTLIKGKIHLLKKLGPELTMVISLDGNKNINNEVRGNNTYEEVIDGIAILNNLKRTVSPQIKIVINTVLNENLILHLSEYIDLMNDLSVDKVILNYPWYISDSGRRIMDDYYRNNFPQNTEIEKLHSWHFFRFSIPPAFYPLLKNQIEVVKQKKINFQFRLQPNIEPREALSIVNCNYPKKYSNNSFCLATYNRMSVCANGNVSACPDFPEFVLGNLINQTLKGIWNSSSYNRIRQIRTKGLWPLPTCFKCSLFSFNRL